MPAKKENKNTKPKQGAVKPKQDERGSQRKEVNPQGGQQNAGRTGRKGGG